MTGKINRRTLVKGGAAIFGAGLLGSFTKASSEPNVSNNSHIFNVRDFGATGTRDEKATIPLRNAVETCTLAGGGTVYIPPGDYTVGTVQLKDNVTLHIDTGATLYLSQNPDDFIQGARSMIFAEKAKNISVIGKGRLDGLARYDYLEMRDIDLDIAEEIEIAKRAGVDMRRYYRSSTSMNTFMFVINECTNVLLEDITVINSPLWNIRFTDCDRIFVRGIYIFSDLEKGVNADGIAICSSRNVIISDSVIVTGDDSIVLKTRQTGREIVNPTENVVVTNCVLTSSSTPLMIGTETHADIRHVIFSNCTIRDSNKGFGINVQDGATVSDVLISNLTIEKNRRHWNWWGSAEMCKFILFKRNESSRLGHIQNVVVDNIISHARGTSTITGHKDQPLENIRFGNVQIFMNHEDAIDKRASHALKVENINGLKIRDLSVKWAENQTEDNWQSALALKNVSDFDIWSFSGRQGLKNSNYPAILLDNVSEGLIRDSSADKGCAVFVHLMGHMSNNIILRNNITKNAITEVSYENEYLRKAIEII